MSNKTRVFVAIYTRPEASNTSTASSRKSRPKAQNFHWGLWLEPKGSTGEGTSFDLEDSSAYTSISSPFGWRLHIDEHKSIPSHMLGRIMIGKMVEGSSDADVGQILTQVQLPSEPGSEVSDAVEWIKRVITELQGLECAESFGVDVFMERALSYAVSWNSKKSKKESEKVLAEKVNYTWSRTFP